MPLSSHVQHVARTGGGPVREVRYRCRLRPAVNGEVVQDGRTTQMVYTVGDTLALISHTVIPRSGDRVFSRVYAAMRGLPADPPVASGWLVVRRP